MQIEIDEGEYRALQQRASSAEDARKVVDALSSNPKTRRVFLQSLKAIAPNTVIPEIDAAAPYEAQLNAMKKQMDDDRLERQKEKDDEQKEKMSRTAQENIDFGRKMLRSKGYNDDGVAGVEKLMGDRGIVDYDIAETYFAKQNPPAEPIFNAGNYGRNFGLTDVDEGDADHKLLMEKPEAWKNKTINKFVQEMRDHRRHA